MRLVEIRDDRINVRLAPEERDALERLCRAERLPMSAVIRRLIWDAAAEE